MLGKGKYTDECIQAPEWERPHKLPGDMHPQTTEADRGIPTMHRELRTHEHHSVFQQMLPDVLTVCLETSVHLSICHLAAAEVKLKIIQ